jgi:mRNA interferase MazF
VRFGWLISTPPEGKRFKKFVQLLSLVLIFSAQLPSESRFQLRAGRKNLEIALSWFGLMRTQTNGLNQDSAGNLLQIRSLATERFICKLGQVTDEILQELLSGFVICVDYEQKS